MFSKIRQLFSNAVDGSRFILRIDGGRLLVSKGRLPSAFLSDLSEYIASSGLVSGVIRGHGDGTRTRLVFSSDIPAEAHQRVRNIWHFHESSLRIDA